MLIDLLDGETRQLLVRARVLAMRDGCSAGTQLLADDPSKSAVARIAMALVRSELHYLDQDFVAASRIYDAHVGPLLDNLSPESAAYIIDNRTTISHMAFEPEGIDKFYHEVDVRRILGVVYRALFSE